MISSWQLMYYQMCSFMRSNSDAPLSAVLCVVDIVVSGNQARWSTPSFADLICAAGTSSLRFELPLSGNKRMAFINGNNRSLST